MTGPFSPHSPTGQQEILERAFPIKGDAGSKNHPNMKEDQCLLVVFIPMHCRMSCVLRLKAYMFHTRCCALRMCSSTNGGKRGNFAEKMHKAFHMFLKKVIAYKVLPIKRKIIHCMSMSRCHLKYEIIGEPKHLLYGLSNHIKSMRRLGADS